MKSRLEKNKDKQVQLEEEERKKHQQKVVKRVLQILLVLFVLVFSFCLYITKISTVQLLVKEKNITSSKIPASFHGYKIVQFSDLHYQDHTLLKDTVTAIKLRKPDLILFTGDLLDTEKLTPQNRQHLVDELKKLPSSSLKFAVLGESDTNEAISILNDCGFTVLNNTYELLYQETEEPILLMGMNTEVEDKNIASMLGYYEIPEHNDAIFSLLMLHQPDSLDEVLAQRKVDLAFAGHSHFGQVRLPFLGGLLKKEGALKYQKDYYKLDTTEFYISSGIGCSEFPYRFQARPSITFLRLISTAS